MKEKKLMAMLMAEGSLLLAGLTGCGGLPLQRAAVLRKRCG